MLMTLIIIIAILGAFAFWKLSNQRPFNPDDDMPKRKKAKRPPLPPLDVDIQPHWVKCKIEYERSTQRESPIQSMYFSFYDKSETRVHSESYRNREAEAYSPQLSKLLEREGFTYSENSSYREWETYIYERKSEH